MAIKVRANERLLKFNKDSEGEYRYCLAASIYNTLSANKVIKEAALRSGISQGVMQACWGAAGEVIKAWAVEGHSVAIPGLGHMRFGLRSTSVSDVTKVSTELITSRRVIFTPSTDIKQELANTSISITCYDRNGAIVKQVTSTDPGTVEDPEDENNTESGNASNGGNTGTNSNGTSTNSSNTNSNGNGATTGGTTGGNTSGNGSSEQGQEGDYRLVIYKYGNGTMTVTDDSEQVINTNDNVHSGSNVNISVVPVDGKEPIAKVNGNRITLTENEGTYTGSFQMPTKGTVLEINSEPDEWDYADQN
jgi:hypothetical protein